MNTWFLVIFFVAASGSSPGAAIDKIEFTTEATCERAAEKIREEAEPWRFSHVDAVCIKRD